jgi:glycosyltransferase involved in cell wall biosynthesis
VPPAPEGSERGRGIDSPTLTVVIPTFNESARLEHGLDRLRGAAREGALDLDRTEILVVDDGSVDDTRSVAVRLTDAFPHARVLSHVRNLGKGAAVRTGVLAATGELVVFADADMAIDPSHLPALVEALGRVPVAVGSRAVHGHVDYGSRLRTDAGRIFNLAVRGLGGVHLADTQCGFKGFRRSAALLLAHFQTTTGYEFDVELLWLAGCLGLEVEVVPVTWLDVPGSSVRVARDSVRMLADLVGSRRRRRYVAAVDVGSTTVSGAPAGAVLVATGHRSILCASVADVAALRASTSRVGQVRLMALDELAALRPLELTAPD